CLLPRRNHAPVQLQIAETEKEVGGATVAGAAFGAAWITPGLLPETARKAPVFDAELLLFTCCRYQSGVGFFLVPSIRIASPLPGLLQKYPRFDSLDRSRIARLAF